MGDFKWCGRLSPENMEWGGKWVDVGMDEMGGDGVGGRYRLTACTSRKWSSRCSAEGRIFRQCTQGKVSGSEIK